MGRNKGRKANKFNNFGGHGMTYQQVDLPYTYCINEHLGTEDRSTEFKNGPGFIRHGFRENVAKYVCGFVNSQQNGKLLIGVNDRGEVTGYDCSHREEDHIRRDVDEAVKDLVPAIFPEDYSVRFVPVTNEAGHLLGNVKVIEIIVSGGLISKKDVLYQTKQGVFMRRDGSVQELKAADIQEWDRRKFQPEIDKLKKNEQNFVRDLHNKENEIRQLNTKLEQKNEELKRREEALAQYSSVNDKLNEDRQQMELKKAEEQLQNKDKKIRELEKLLEQKDEELRSVDEATARQMELNDLSDNVSQHQPELDGAKGSDRINARFDRLEEMLQKQNKKSKVCVIS